MLPMPPRPLEALSRWPRVIGKDDVVRHRRRRLRGWFHAKRRLDARLGFDRDWDLHDLRRSVQTRMIRLGISRDVVNRILNHAMGPIDEAYDLHDYLSEKAEALRRWADELERIIGRELA